MTNNVEDFQKFSKDQISAETTSSSSFVNNLQTIAAETTDYSKKAFEDGAAFLEKLRGVKSVESAIQVQSDYAKASYDAFIAQATKVGELYSKLGKEAFKPAEALIAKVQSRKD